MSSVSMPTERIQAVCTALLKIAPLQAEPTRSLFLEETQTMLGRSINVTRMPASRLDLYSILRACEREPGGLAAFMRVVGSFNEGSVALAEAERIVHEWVYQTWQQRLIELCASVAPADLAVSAAAISGLPVSESPPDALIQGLGWQHSPRWGVPAMVALAALLADEQALSAPLQQWVDEVVNRLGIEPSTVAEMRSAIAQHRETVKEIELLDKQPVDNEPEPDMRKTIIIEQATTPLVSETVIRGGVPARNPYFTGRESLLNELEAHLQAQNRASVLPETLHGLGGVGKTQVALEYAYRHSDDYQLIWWITAEESHAVRSSLSALAGRLGLPAGPSMDLTVRTVLDALATSPMQWLLVYDNAGDVADIEHLIPAAGGHIIVTSRNPEWAVGGRAIEVDVFDRAESKEMLRKRRPEMTDGDADRLAERLGDLPLALEQAVSWLISTLTSVEDYIVDFDRQSRALLSRGRPRQYPTTVLTFVALALSRLRETAPVSAMLLELMAFFGPDPIPAAVFWAGRGAQVTEPLRSALGERIEVGQAVRDLAKFGLAKVDNPGQRIQVHRLVQLILREELVEERLESARQNSRALLAAANPGYPDNQETWPRHAELAPHIRVAGLIEGTLDERRAALDHLRYIYNIGDYEGARELAEQFLRVLTGPPEKGGQPAGDPLALLTRRRYADALRQLGDFPAARKQSELTLEQMRAALGERHEYTLGAVIGLAADLRIAGDFGAARELDERNLELHREVLGESDNSTLRAMLNVAIDLRMSGDMQAAYEIDVEAERLSRRALGENDALTFYAISGKTRDLYGLGRYGEALDLLEQTLPTFEALLGSQHTLILYAESQISVLLRKLGRLAEAAARARENYRTTSVRFGAGHQQTLAATMTYANAQRCVGELVQARLLAQQGFEGYRDLYGARHPLTSCAAVNLAIVHRADRSDWEARRLDQSTMEVMTGTLTDEHPYVLCLQGNLINDLVLAHKIEQACEQSVELLEVSNRVRGHAHPYTLGCAVNAGLNLIAADDRDKGQTLLDEAVAAMSEMFGAEHPDVRAARQGKRFEFDIEPPPW
jgi:hypothetical protein